MSDLLRLNLGCGAYPLDGWWNVDQDPAVPADWHRRVPPILLDDDSCAEVYCGHLLEHFDYDGGQALLRECLRVLVPGGRLGVVVPDTRTILTYYLERRPMDAEVPQGRHWSMADLDDVCALFLYSTMQPSRHQWSYDGATLRRALERAGFQVGRRIDPFDDPRHSCGAWWNLGLDAVKPEVPPCG